MPFNAVDWCVALCGPGLVRPRVYFSFFKPVETRHKSLFGLRSRHLSHPTSVLTPRSSLVVSEKVS